MHKNNFRWALLNLFFVACSLQSFAAHGKEKTIVALLWSPNIEGQVAMRKGLEEVHKAASEKESSRQSKLIIKMAGDGKEGIRNQIQQFKEALELNPNLIVIQPTDNASLSASLKLANKKNIPVIAFDQFISGGKLLSYITSDNKQAGKLNAEYIHSLFPKEKKLHIVLLEYSRVSSTIERVDGFLDTLKELHRDFEIKARYEAVEPIGGKKAAERFLKEFPKKSSIDVVFSVNDGAGIPFTELLTKAGRNEIVHGTVDGDPASVENIKAKKITKIDAAQFCAEIGRQTMTLALDHLNGVKVPKKVLIPTFPITIDTVRLYDGWLGKMPQPFNKPWSKENSQWTNELKKHY